MAWCVVMHRDNFTCTNIVNVMFIIRLQLGSLMGLTPFSHVEIIIVLNALHHMAQARDLCPSK